MRGDGSSRGIMDRGETVFCGILSIEFTENTGRRFPGHSCWSMVPATLPKSRPPSHNDIEIYRDADGGFPYRHFCARVSFLLASLILHIRNTIGFHYHFIAIKTMNIENQSIEDIKISHKLYKSMVMCS